MEESNEPWWWNDEGMTWSADAVVSGPTSESNTASDHQVESPPKKVAKKAADRRPAAKKAAAKPKPSSVSPTSTELCPVKAEPATNQARTPARTESHEDTARAQAAHDNLNRASTGSQLAATPRNPFEEEDEIEAALDRAVKREERQPSTPTQAPQHSRQAPPPKQSRQAPEAPQAEGHPHNGDSDSQEQQQQNIDEQRGRKKKRVKTAAAKAAHARYMRFSRSFDRPLDTERIMN